MLERIKKILSREKKSEEPEEEEEVGISKEEVEELVKKAKRVMRETELDEDPWEEFKALCKEVGSDYREVISKAAWKYLEDTGGVEVLDPLTRAKEVANILRELNEALEVATEPDSLKKVKTYSKSIKEVAELKKALAELKSEKISAADVLAIMKKIGVL